MRLTLCNEVLREMPFARRCDYAAALGYQGLELAPFTMAPSPLEITPAAVAAARRAAKDAGIAISGLHWLLVKPDGLSITSADAAVRVRTRAVIARLVDLCAEFGGSYLVHGSPAQRRIPAGADAQAGRARGVDMLTFAAERAARAGVIYVLEPLPASATEFATTLAEAAAILREVDSPALRTMIDACASAEAETDTLEALVDTWMPRGIISHIHLNDANRKAPGQGKTRFGPLLQSLRRHGYAGWMGVEPFDYVPDGAGCAAYAMGYLAALEDRA